MLPNSLPAVEVHHAYGYTTVYHERALVYEYIDNNTTLLLHQFRMVKM